MNYDYKYLEAFDARYDKQAADEIIDECISAIDSTVYNSIELANKKYDIRLSSINGLLYDPDGKVTKNDLILYDYVKYLLDSANNLMVINMRINIINNVLLPLDKDFDSILSFDISLLFNQMQQSGQYKNMTLEFYRCNLVSFFKWMRENDIISTNPLNGIKPFDKEEKEESLYDIILTQDEVNAIMNYNHKDKYKVIIYLLLFTGLKARDIVNIKVGDIDFDNMILPRFNAQDEIYKRIRVYHKYSFVMDVVQEYVKKYNLSADDLLIYSVCIRPLIKCLVRDIEGVKRRSAPMHIVFRRTFEYSILTADDVTKDEAYDLYGIGLESPTIFEKYID